MNLKSYFLTFLATSLWIGNVQAQNINFGKIGSGEQAFKQYWKLSDEESARYNNYMAIAGKYRHQHLDPLTVLSIIADTPEDREFYAKKAALYEHQISMKEIETAFLISTAMEDNATEMQAFTDKLIGIDTMGYQAEKTPAPQWQAGDTLMLFLDTRCLTSACIAQHTALISGIKADSKIAVITGKTQPPTETLQALEKMGFSVKRFDPIEHHYLSDALLNRPLHIRNAVATVIHR